MSISVHQVARKTGYSSGWLSNLENGKAALRNWTWIADLVKLYGENPAEWRKRWEEIHEHIPPMRSARQPGNGTEIPATEPAAEQEEPGGVRVPDALADLVDKLATELESQWRGERTTTAMPVRWALSWDLADDRPVVVPNGIVEDTFSGDLDSAADFVLRLPHRRLVLLGESGTGKSTVAAHLLLGLLRRRRPGEPVPVLLSLSGWDPSAQSPAAWLTQELAANYPALAAPWSKQDNRAGALVSSGLVTPILDGLDEMADPLRPRALRRINAMLRRGDALILTSRGKEYEAAVRDQAGRVLDATAVARLQPPMVDEVRAFLERVTEKHRRTAWTPVFERVAKQPHGPLATALRSPLMAWSAAVVYGEGRADPAELLGFNGQTTVERHLLDRLVSTFYHEDWAEDWGPEPTLDREPLHPAPASADARSWLTFLSDHLADTDSSDIAWWRLDQEIPRAAMGIVNGMVFALVVGVAIGIPSAFAHDSRIGLAWGLIGGATAGIAGGLVLYLLINSRDAVPSTVRFHLRRGRRLHLPDTRGPAEAPLHRHLVEGLGVGAASGAVIGLLVALVKFLFGDENGATPSGAIAAVAVFLAVSLSRVMDFWLSAPLDVMTSVSPASVLRGDRIAALSQGLIGGLTFGLTFGIGRSPAAGLAAGVAAALTRTFISGLDQGFSEIRVTAWGRFILARLWLAARGKLPLRTMAFLRDAHYRGLLRQVGAVYQFRHNELEHSLRSRSVQEPRDSGGA